MLIFVSLSCFAKDNDWQEYFFSGLNYESQGRISAAIGAYQKSLKAQENSLAFWRLAKIYLGRKDHKSAVKIFKELLKIDSSQRLSYYYLGRCLFEQGDYKQAYKYLSRAENFYPGNEKVRLLAVKLKKKLGKSFFKAEKAKKAEKRKSVRLVSYQPKVEIPTLRVAVAAGIEEFTFSCGTKFGVTDGEISYKGEPNKFYRLRKTAKGFDLSYGGSDLELVNFNRPPRISPVLSNNKSFLFCILDISSGSGNFWHRRMDRKYRGALQVQDSGDSLSLINIVSIEEYLYGVLPSEILANSPQNSLYAQAVAARTLALRASRHESQGYDFCADVHCQVYKGFSAENRLTNNAVDLTRGEILIFEDEPIEVFYHSNCGGCLSADVFGSLPYLENKIDAKAGKLPDSTAGWDRWLESVPDTFCSGALSASFRWQRAYDVEDFAFIFGFELKDLRDIKITETGQCRRIKKIELVTSSGKKEISGGLKIRDFFDKLRSNSFKISLLPADGDCGPMIIFWGAGFGHGTGMCQTGAIEMGRQGYTYKQILKQYYPGATIEKVY